MPKNLTPTRPDDADHLRRSDLWPCWPVQPMKRRSSIPGKMPQIGICVDGQMDPPKVFLINMYELVSGPIGPQLVDVEKREYPDIETMLAEGWVVD